jgi:hypothetical protein
MVLPEQIHADPSADDASRWANAGYALRKLVQMGRLMNGSRGNLNFQETNIIILYFFWGGEIPLKEMEARSE